MKLENKPGLSYNCCMKGIIVPLITPIKNNHIDEVSLKSLIDYVIKGSVDALFILGTTGEFQFLSLSEKKRLLLKTIEYTKKRVPLLVGISSLDEQEIQMLLDFSEKLELDALVLTFLDLAKKENQLEMVVKKTRLPILLYNNPALQQGGNLDMNFIQKAQQYKTVVGIKDSSGDWDYFQKLLSLKTDTFDVYYGRTEKLIDALNLQASGLVNGYANIAPELLTKLFLTKSIDLYAEVLEMKNQLNKLSQNQIEALKIRMRELEVINSAEMATLL
jgi:4-hydroxy-tetrahydrodipicolinate synthase